MLTDVGSGVMEAGVSVVQSRTAMSLVMHVVVKWAPGRREMAITQYTTAATAGVGTFQC